MHPNWPTRNHACLQDSTYEPGERTHGLTFSAVPKLLARPEVLLPWAGGAAILGRRARAVLAWRTRLRTCARTSSFVALITTAMFYFGGVIFRIAPFLSLPAADLRISHGSPHHQARD
jgi:hypothetical protein